MSFMAEDNVPQSACKQEQGKTSHCDLQANYVMHAGFSFDCGVNDDADWMCRLNSKLVQAASLCLLDFCDGKLAVYPSRIEIDFVAGLN